MLEKIKLGPMFDESVELIKWEGYQSVLLVNFLIICAGVGVFSKGLFVHYIWKYAPSGRPINLMFLRDQAVQLVTIAICSSLVIISLIKGQPLEQILGYEACWILWSSSTIINLSHSMGGLEMAFYRLICIKYPFLALNQKKSQKIVKSIFILDVIVNVTIFSVAVRGIELAGTNLTFEFCRGHSRSFSKILSMYEGHSSEDINAGLRLNASMIIVGQLAILSEFAIYVYLFLVLYKESKNNSALTIDKKKKKVKKNSITLSGQALSFLIEIVGGVTWQILLVSNAGAIETAAYLCILIVLVTVISVSHFVACPELARHYFDFDP